MKKTINISHFISKETLSNIKLAQDSVNKMIQSDSFKGMIEKASRIDRVLKINIASFYRSREFKKLQNTVEILGENRNKILSAISTINYQSLDYQNHKIQIEDQNTSSLTTQNKKFKEEDFIRLDYQLTLFKDENKNLKYEVKALKDENKALLGVKNRYISEKKKGGSNSYKQNHPLKKTVHDLCKKELKRKNYPSANQLCNKISKQIENNHKDLLLEFTPYQTYLNDGGFWTKGTFYNWCNANYKEFK